MYKVKIEQPKNRSARRRGRPHARLHRLADREIELASYLHLKHMPLVTVYHTTYYQLCILLRQTSDYRLGPFHILFHKACLFCRVE